jgi:hypothetical protein
VQILADVAAVIVEYFPREQFVQTNALDAPVVFENFPAIQEAQIAWPYKG